jgi:hypothetical protein
MVFRDGDRPVANAIVAGMLLLSLNVVFVLVGGVATFVILWCFAVLLWLPLWLVLRRTGWIWIDDGVARATGDGRA